MAARWSCAVCASFGLRCAYTASLAMTGTNCIRIYLTLVTVVGGTDCHSRSSTSQAPAASVTQNRGIASRAPVSDAAVSEPPRPRKRRHIDMGLPVPHTTGPFPLATMNLKQPKDAKGRVISIAPDDSCFVEAKNVGGARDAGAPARIAVDCPIEFDEPSWNDCVEGALHVHKYSRECWCVPNGAHAPSKFRLVPCPEHSR